VDDVIEYHKNVPTTRGLKIKNTLVRFRGTDALELTGSYSSPIGEIGALLLQIGNRIGSKESEHAN
jgi:hypothetical protein